LFVVFDKKNGAFHDFLSADPQQASPLISGRRMSSTRHDGTLGCEHAKKSVERINVSTLNPCDFNNKDRALHTETSSSTI
jgi:hypothetical protein